PQMGNPAALLLEQFREWSTATGTQAVARGFNHSSSEALKKHVEAMDHIKTLAKIVDVLREQGKRVERYDRVMPAWIRAVLAYPVGWNAANASKTLFTPHA